jgi:hypothetical protein
VDIGQLKTVPMQMNRMGIVRLVIENQAAPPVSPPRWHPASKTPDPIAMPERKSRRVF